MLNIVYLTNYVDQTNIHPRPQLGSFFDNYYLSTRDETSAAFWAMTHTHEYDLKDMMRIIHVLQNSLVSKYSTIIIL